MDGNLLADRYYEIDVEHRNFYTYEVDYYDDKIKAFADDGGGPDSFEEIVIKMPPTWLNRFRASFPLIRPKEE
jgi:hypothetical protein